jgi:hypothetical protein
MTRVLRKQHAQESIEGQEPPPDWSDDDYAVVDEGLVGRIYRQQVQGDIKWLWFLHLLAPAPNQDIAERRLLLLFNGPAVYNWATVAPTSENGWGGPSGPCPRRSFNLHSS